MPGIIGKGAENYVLRKLSSLDTNKYKVLKDLMIPSKGHSSNTQIDIVVVSNFGVFCIEVKAYKGWIFGNAQHKYWTQVIYKYKKKDLF